MTLATRERAGKHCRDVKEGEEPSMCLGVPGRIVELRNAEHHIAVVDVEGVPREVSLGMLVDGSGGLPPEGSWVVVHLGFALALIDEAEAAATLEALHSLDPQ